MIHINKVNEIIRLHKRLEMATDALDHGKNAFSAATMMESFLEVQKNTTPEAQSYNKANDELSSYMLSLSYAEILDIEALMDYGRFLYGTSFWRNERDNIPDDPDIDMCENDEQRPCSPTRYIAQKRQEFQSMYPSEDGKESAIDYIISKSLLSEYLACAIDALRVNKFEKMNNMHYSVDIDAFLTRRSLICSALFAFMRFVTVPSQSNTVLRRC